MKTLRKSDSFVKYQGHGNNETFAGLTEDKDQPLSYELNLSKDLMNPSLQIVFSTKLTDLSITDIRNYLTREAGNPGACAIHPDSLTIETPPNSNATTLTIKDPASILKFLHIARIEAYKLKEQSKPAQISLELNRIEQQLYEAHRNEKPVIEWTQQQIEITTKFVKDFMLIPKRDELTASRDNKNAITMVVSSQLITQGIPEPGTIKKKDEEFSYEFGHYLKNQVVKMKDAKNLDALLTTLQEIRFSPYLIKGSKIDFVKEYLTQLNALYAKTLQEIEEAKALYSPIYLYEIARKAEAEQKEDKSETTKLSSETTQTIAYAKVALQGYLNMKPEGKAKPVHLGLFKSADKGHNRAKAYQKLLQDKDFTSDLHQNIILYALLDDKKGPTLCAVISAALLDRSSDSIKDKDIKSALALLEDRIKDDLPSDKKFSHLKKAITEINNYAHEEPDSKKSHYNEAITELKSIQPSAPQPE